MTLGIVIVTRNRSNQCRDLCTRLEEQIENDDHGGAELLLVFDGCEPYEWVPERPPYRTVHIAERRGIAAARNIGIADSSWPVVAFLDDDVVPDPAWLVCLREGLVRYPLHLAFGGRVGGLDSANIYSQLRDQVYYREVFGPWYADRSLQGDCFGPPYVNGGNAAYRRVALDRVDGFDERLPSYSDVEMGGRLDTQSCGVLLSGMSVIHDHPSTFASYIERCTRSGAARALIWRTRRYPEHSPWSVFVGVVVNIVARNGARAGRLPEHRAKALTILFCQEVAHGYAYTASLFATVELGAAVRGGSIAPQAC